MNRLPLNAFSQSADYEYGRHVARLPFDVTLRDTLQPGYWATVAPQLRAGSIIRAFRPDFSLDVDLCVTKVEPGLAFVILRGGHFRKEAEDAVEALRAEGAVAASAPVAPDHDLEELGPDYKIGAAGGKFYVQFKPTRQTIFTNLNTKAEAVAKAKEHKAKSGVTV